MQNRSIINVWYDLKYAYVRSYLSMGFVRSYTSSTSTPFTPKSYINNVNNPTNTRYTRSTWFRNFEHNDVTKLFLILERILLATLLIRNCPEWKKNPESSKIRTKTMFKNTFLRSFSRNIPSIFWMHKKCKAQVLHYKPQRDLSKYEQYWQ